MILVHKHAGARAAMVQIRIDDRSRVLSAEKNDHLASKKDTAKFFNAMSLSTNTRSTHRFAGNADLLVFFD